VDYLAKLLALKFQDLDLLLFHPELLLEFPEQRQHFQKQKTKIKLAANTFKFLIFLFLFSAFSNLS
jgi:hypothetical protein